MRARKKKKIVLAEGQSVIAEILPQFLKPIGYEVIVSPDGQAALWAIKRELPSLIIVDSDLAVIDGLSLCKILKSDFLTSYIPIIILIEKRQLRKRILEIQEGIDDYILKPPDPIDLQVRLEMALRRTDHQMHANSLTRLPGNKAIEHVSRQKIAEGNHFSFMYLDIDNFKSFNDTYGYLRGDGAIMQTARIISDCVLRFGQKDDFVGHVGGDDFVVMTNPQKEEAVAKAIIREFNRLMPLHYDPADRTKGYLLVRDRQKNEIKAPLMSISIAIVNNKVRQIKNIIELTEIASEIKKHLKTMLGSKYLVNRRRNEFELSDEDEEILSQKGCVALPKDSPVLPIGQILLKAKLIDEQQLREALFEHWSSRELLGQTLIKMGLVKKEELEPFLKNQTAYHAPLAIKP